MVFKLDLNLNLPGVLDLRITPAVDSSKRRHNAWESFEQGSIAPDDVASQELVDEIIAAEIIGRTKKDYNKDLIYPYVHFVHNKYPETLLLEDDKLAEYIFRWIEIDVLNRLEEMTGKKSYERCTEMQADRLARALSDLTDSEILLVIQLGILADRDFYAELEKSRTHDLPQRW